MLGKIKSIFFIRQLLFQLDIKRKFKLFQYNKNWQHFIDVNLINYKIVSGKYIIYEDKEKRKGKEYFYFNDVLIFEGEYSKGKRHGKGKEYNISGKLIFEGEYSNGKKHGKGKEYNISKKLIFEGEYSNGKKWNGIWKFQNKDYEIKNGNGIIKDYIENNLIYEGEYSKGEKNGKCKIYFSDNKLFFEGEYLNGKVWNGKGTLNNHQYTIENGNLSIKEYNNEGLLIFSLEYLRGKKNGKWKQCDNNGKLIFETEYLDGKKDGKSIEYNDSGQLIFDGEYSNGRKSKGREYFRGKLNYEGEYFYGFYWNGKGYDGKGNLLYEVNNGIGNVRIFFYPFFDKFIIIAGYIHGKTNEKMKMYTFNGALLYEYILVIDKKMVTIKEYDKNNGKLISEGEYFDGRKQGKFKEYNPENGILIFEGEYLNGIKNGKCKEYNKLNGELIYEGEYFNGKRLDIFTICEIYLNIIILYLNWKIFNLTNQN